MTQLLIRISVIAAVVMFLAFAFTHSCYRTFTPYKYKLTVNIEYKRVIYNGSTVVRIVPHVLKTIVGEGGGEIIKGQAAFIRIPGEKIIFVTIPTQDYRQPQKVPFIILSKSYGIIVKSSWDAGGWRVFARQRGKHALSVDELPSMVTFSDLNDPRSIIYLDPNDLKSSLGGNARYISATLEVVDEPISKGITKLLPWLRHFNETYKISPLCKADKCLDSEDFAQGVS